MFRLIKLNSSFFYILQEEIKNSDNLEFLECFRIPSVQPGPGCKVGVASLGKQENLTVQPAHIVDNTADHCFHGFIIAGE